VAYPDYGAIQRIADFEYSMKGDERFICSINFLNGEVRFAEALNAGSSDDFHVAGCTPVSIGYQIVLRLLIDIPTKPVQNILEWMNHSFFICCVCD
jgi:hypothetical protein